MNTQRLIVSVVIAFRLFTSLEPAARAQGSGTLTAGGELFTDQVLALPSLTESHPLLILASAQKGQLNRLHTTLAARRVTLGNHPTSASRQLFATDTISAGFSPSQLRGFRTWRLMDATFLDNWIENEYPGLKSMAEIILQTAHHVLAAHSSLRNIVLAAPDAGETFLKWPLEPLRAMHWWMAEVKNPHHYWLGGPGADLLALDLVLFLEQLQTLGEARDGAGEIVAALRDESGKPYPYLVAEYVLHERLEETVLVHDAVIALTTKSFGYGLYYPDDGYRPPSEALRDTRVFTRPGQTPLGQALRSFIQWRFTKAVRQLTEHLVVICFYEPSKRSVLSTLGEPTAIHRTDRLDSALLIRQHDVEMAIPTRNIINIREVDELETDGLFFGIHDVGLNKIVRLLQIGQQVDLWEWQVRLGIHSWPENHALCQVFQSLLTARDREGTRIYLGRRLYLKDIADTLVWARELGEALFALDLRLIVKDVTFGVHAPLFFYFGGMRNLHEIGDEHESHDIIEYLLRAVVSFATLTILPRIGPNRRSQMPTQGLQGHDNLPSMKMSAKGVPLSRCA